MFRLHLRHLRDLGCDRHHGHEPDPAGERVDAATRTSLEERYGSDAAKQVADATKKPAAPESGLMQVVKTLVPSNPIAAAAGIRAGEERQTETPNMLHLMLFAVLLGVAATLVKPEITAPLLAALQGLFEICCKIIDIIMKVAPFAVACLLFNNTARFGLDLLSALGWFVVTALLASRSTCSASTRSRSGSSRASTRSSSSAGSRP
jgi:DAACS family dicarboxylate/amino acid:cation (Na+ or H+) symporter